MHNVETELCSALISFSEDSLINIGGYLLEILFPVAERERRAVVSDNGNGGSVVVETDRCVALVSSGHRRLRPGFLQDVANLPDSPEPLSRSSRDCHSLATTPACQLSSVACLSRGLPPTVNQPPLFSSVRQISTALRGWGPAFSPNFLLSFHCKSFFVLKRGTFLPLFSYKMEDSLNY